MHVLWKKIWRDVSTRKARTFQVVLSIGVGVFAIGLTMGLLDAMQDRMTAVWRASTPAHITAGSGFGFSRLGPGVNDDTVRAIGNLPGIDGAEGQSSTNIRWKQRLEDEWEPATLIARADYDNQKYDRLTLDEGTWPSGGGATVERGTAGQRDLPLDSTIYFEVNERPRPMRVVGVVYDPWANPVAFGGDAAFNVTRRDMEKLGGSADFNEIKAVLAEYDEEAAKAGAQDVADRLDRLGISHGAVETFDPERHFFQDTINGIFLLLVVMSFLTLALSLFLVVNTITAIVTEQVPQIGVMKAIGAGPREIFRIYLSSVMIYVVLALAIAIPLGVLGAFQLTTVMLGVFNMHAEGLKFPLAAVSTQLAVGLLAPLAAALLPVTAAARTTVRDAISGYGLSVGAGLIERGLSRLRGLPPLVTMTASNTFRHKGRLAMTLVALVFGGAIFMMVMTVRASMFGFFDGFLETYRFNVMIGFERPQRIASTQTMVGGLPGIEYAEMLQFQGGVSVRRIDDPEGLGEESLQLIGVAKTGNAYGPVVTAGRYLLPDDQRAVVLNEHLAEDLGTLVGDDVVIEINETERLWTVVGLLSDANANQTASVVWLDVLARETNSVGRGRTLFVGTTAQDEASLDGLAQELRDWLDGHGRDVSSALTSATFTERNSGGLIIIVYLLLVIAVLIAVVGAVGLSGALSIGALERQTEIGVMRAIGASGRAVGGIFVGEGLMIGLFSWLLAVPLSIPLGIAFSQLIADAIDFQFGYQYSPEGAVIWLVIVVVLSIVASGMPAWRATRTSVREVLSYG